MARRKSGRVAVCKTQITTTLLSSHRTQASARLAASVYWCFILTGVFFSCSSVSASSECSECTFGRRVKVSKPIGELIPVKRIHDVNCLTYQIQNVSKGETKVFLRFNNVRLNPSPDGSCDWGYICVGPEPNRKFCHNPSGEPLVFSSVRDHMWVCVVSENNWTNAFTLDYRIDKICDASAISCVLQSTNQHLCMRQSDRRICDGYIDCYRGVDERDCDTKPASCASGTFACIQSYPPRHSTECVRYNDPRRCNNIKECHNGEDERDCEMCDTDEVKCYTGNRWHCLTKLDPRRCNGIKECQNGVDETSCEMCGNKYPSGPYGFITTPNYPHSYPNHHMCEWTIYVKSGHQIQIRFLDFELEDSDKTDSLTIYDGRSPTDHVIGSYQGHHHPKFVVTSSNHALLVFHSDKDTARRGFNISYQIKGFCYGTQLSCGYKEEDCYEPQQRCDEKWDCQLHGGDERGCDPCPDSEFRCGNSNSCYPEKEHCNGLSHCVYNQDELNCNAKLCGSDSGSFLCNNGHCIQETWQCDGTDDCQDNSDEINCSIVSSVRVITAAVIGALICAMLLVIALGCTCKLYALRLQENSASRCYDSPQTRLQQEFFIHRQAPPPYNEAITTSRPFEEAQREFMEQVFIAANRRNRQRRRQQRPPSTSHQVLANDEGSTMTSNTVTGEEDHTAVTDASQTGQTVETASTLPLMLLRRSDVGIAAEEEEDTGVGDDNESSDVNLSLTADMSAQWRRTGANPSRDRVGSCTNPEDVDDSFSDSINMDIMPGETATEITSLDTASGSIDSTVIHVMTDQPLKTGDHGTHNVESSQSNIDVVPEVKFITRLHQLNTRVRHTSNGSEISSDDSNSSELLSSLDIVVNSNENNDDTETMDDDVALIAP